MVVQRSPHRRDGTPRKLTGGVRLAAVALAILTNRCGDVAAQDALTSTEVLALESGALVTRSLHVRRGDADLIGGSSWQRIDAPADRLFRALEDVPRYTQMLPNVTASRLIERRDNSRLIWIKHGGWPLEAAYFVWVQSDPESLTLSFRLDLGRPRSLEAGWGYAQLIPRQDGSTILVWSVLVDVGRGFLAALAQPLIQPWSLRVPSTVKAFWDRTGRALYAPNAALFRSTAAPRARLAREKSRPQFFRTF